MSRKEENDPATGMDPAAAAGVETQAPLNPPAHEDSPDPTPEQIAEWKVNAAKAAGHWDRLLRLNADFENFKKRAARERQDAIRFANEALLAKLIPVLDHFEMAQTAADSAPAGPADSFKTGIQMVFNQLKAALAEAGLEEIDATGQPFNPNLHEAVSQQESAEAPEGQVLQQLRKGYKLRDRLLRPAGVVVAKKPAAGKTEQ